MLYGGLNSIPYVFAGMYAPHVCRNVCLRVLFEGLPAGKYAERRLSEALRGHTACGNKVQAKLVKVNATARQINAPEPVRAYYKKCLMA